MTNRLKIFPVARRNYCHKIKPQVYVHVFTSISVLQNSLSNTTSLTALEILQLLLHFSWLFVTLAVFHDFPGLENGLTKFHDFPGRVVTLLDVSSYLHIWCISRQYRSSSYMKVIGSSSRSQEPKMSLRLGLQQVFANRLDVKTAW